MVKVVVTFLLVIAFGLSTIFLVGCESDAQTGALVGTAAGAGVGAIIGHQSGHTGGGALIGGAAGAAGGYLLGNEGDKKKEKEETKSEINSIRQEMGYVTVPVTNSNGSVIEVRLKKQGTTYIGPRGETYNKLPTEDQLRPVYGF